MKKYSLLFLALILPALFMNGAPTVTVSHHSPKFEEKGTASTKRDYDFKISVSDPTRSSSDNWNKYKLLVDTVNSPASSTKAKNIFLEVEKKSFGIWREVKSLLYQTGVGASDSTKTLFCSLKTPFPSETRNKRIMKAVDRVPPHSDLKLPANTDWIDFFDAYEAIESRPGHYRIKVSYDSSEGIISGTSICIL